MSFQQSFILNISDYMRQFCVVNICSGSTWLFMDSCKNKIKKIFIRFSLFVNVVVVFINALSATIHSGFFWLHATVLLNTTTTTTKQNKIKLKQKKCYKNLFVIVDCTYLWHSLFEFYKCFLSNCIFMIKLH